MNNLSYIELIVSTLDQNQDFMTLKEDYEISQLDLKKVINVITQEAMELDKMGIVLEYGVWEVVIIDSIDRYMTREYDIETGEQLRKPNLYAVNCVRKSIVDNSTINIPGMDYYIEKRSRS